MDELVNKADKNQVNDEELIDDYNRLKEGNEQNKTDKLAEFNQLLEKRDYTRFNGENCKINS